MLVVATFYRFVILSSLEAIKAELEQIANNHDIYGTIIIAEEGINGTVCGTRHAIDSLKSYFSQQELLRDLKYKESNAPENPFLRRHIKIKREIVSFGQPQIDPRAKTGTHVNAVQWNDLLNDPSVIVLDVRNRYETAIGSFSGAVDPEMKTFKDFPRFVQTNLNPAIHKRIAMSCTGGIRCEKASAYMLQVGFAEVYQLDGGILQYLADTTEAESLWRGECFVFDHRVAVGHDHKPGTYSMCYGCREPLSDDDRLSSMYIEEVACPKCYPLLTFERRYNKENRKAQIRRAQALGKIHLGRHAMPSCT